MSQDSSRHIAAFSRRLSAALVLALSSFALLHGQIPGPNVNMVTGTTFPGGDPWLQKQNEPSIAVSTRNPCTLLGGANDYRAVNVPGLATDKELGDAWLGLYKSTDCGQTWFSTLLPGYPQDTSAAGLASPVKGLSAGADPTVRSGPAGMFFYSFIAFNRGSNVGKYAVARYVDKNNREGGDPIQYLGTTLIDSGSAGQFLDKPYIHVTKGTGTCSVDGQTIPASVVHMAWTVFVGNSDQNIRTKVYYARSSNCGVSLDGPPTKLSEGFPVNQGASIAVNPATGLVIVTWRQFLADRTTNAVLVSRSTDGKAFTRAEPIAYLNGFLPFDQGTTSKTFRTNAFPTMAADHNGRVHLAIAVRRAEADQARIVHLSTLDGISWTMPQVVDAAHDTGHQIMPALTYGAGKLQLVWYDLRETEAAKSFASAFGTFIPEIFPVRHTLDVRGAVGTTTNGNTGFLPYGILQLTSNTRPRISRYPLGVYQKESTVDPSDSELRQLQFNRPNLKLYAGGTRPFMGDYIDIAGQAFIARTLDGQQWVLNDGTTPGRNADVFHAVWTDNRDAKVGSAQPEPPGDGAEGSPVGYIGPGTPLCGPENAPFTGARNANVYTSRITPGVMLAIPGNAKPSTCTTCVNNRIQRAFATFVQNTTGQQRTFRLKIENQPIQGFASFDQLATGPTATEMLVTIGPRSSAARSVYVTSAMKYPYVLVTAVEDGVPAGEALAASAILNPDIQNPDIQNPDIQNQEIHNPDIQNPDIQNPDIQNPDIQNPDIQNPDIQNPDIQNPDIQNPDIQNPDIQNPDIQNPDIQNPDVQNPDIQNGSITDVSVDVTNEGNTTSGYQIGVDVDGVVAPYLFQLIARRVYKTPTAVGCQLTEAATNQILFNIPNPTIDGSLFDPNSGDVRNASLILKPGETIRLTLRVWDKDVLTTAGAPANDGIQPFCPMLRGSCSTLTHNVTFAVEAQAYNNDRGTILSEEGRPTATVATTPFEILTATLPGAFAGVPYSEPLENTPGAAPYTWSISAGQLPSGLTLNSNPDTGTWGIGGTADQEESQTFTLRVQDATGRVATREYTVRTMTILSGDMFVVDGSPSATTGSILRMRPNVEIGGYTTTLVATIAGRPADIAAGAVHGLVAVDPDSASVIKVTPGHTETIVSGGLLSHPIAVAIDGAGNIYVGDNGSDKVFRYSDGAVIEWADLPDSSIELQGIDIKVAGPNVYVSDDGGSTVTLLRIHAEGVETVVDETATIQRASGIVVAGTTIYVADFNQTRIFRVLTSDGVQIEEFLSVAGIGANMSDLATDGTGFIIPINMQAAIKRVTVAENGTAVITTIQQGGLLTYPNGVLVLPIFRGGLTTSGG